MTPSAVSLEFKHKSELSLSAWLQHWLMVGSSKNSGQTVQTKLKSQISNRWERLWGLSFPHVLEFGVRLWLPYLEGHNEMSEMKLSLQVQLDSHIFQTCRGREKVFSKQGHLPVSTSKFCQSMRLLAWDYFLYHLVCCEKEIRWFSACLRYRGRHQEPAKEYHTWGSCTWSAPNTPHPEREPAVLFETEPWPNCWIWGKDGTTTSWALAPKLPVQLGMLSPDPCGGHRLFSHTPASLGAAAAQASAALTPPVSLMSHWFPTIFHSLWSLLTTRTAPL